MVSPSRRQEERIMLARQSFVPQPKSLNHSNTRIVQRAREERKAPFMRKMWDGDFGAALDRIFRKRLEDETGIKF